MAPGVIWVSSRVSHLPCPRTNVDALTPEKFCDWYENIHIQEVTALSGVPRAARYEAINSNDEKGALSDKAPWLTVYEMFDIDYRMTGEFRGLNGQSAPDGELLQGVFEQARFDTRFYEEVDAEASFTGKDPAEYMVSWTSDRAASVDVEKLRKIGGFKRVRRFIAVAGTTLEHFERVDALSDGRVGKELALIEFESVMDVEEVRGVIGKGELDEVGWYRLKRMYGE